jgi:hypothetical protein
MLFRAHRWAAVASAVFSFFLAANTTQASVVLLDTRTGASFVPGTGYSIFNLGFASQSVALPFTSSGTWTITNVDTYISSQFSGVTIDLGIMADNGGRPSGMFLSKVTVDLTSDPLSLNSLNWAIDPGSKYWLAAVAQGEDASWGQSAIQGTLGFTNGSDWSTESNFLPAALIQADLTSETPLPGALALFASGLGGFCLFGRRGRRKMFRASQLD